MQNHATIITKLPSSTQISSFHISLQEPRTHISCELRKSMDVLEERDLNKIEQKKHHEAPCGFPRSWKDLPPRIPVITRMKYYMFWGSGIPINTTWFAKLPASWVDSGRSNGYLDVFFLLKTKKNKAISRDLKTTTCIKTWVDWLFSHGQNSTTYIISNIYTYHTNDKYW